MEFYEKEPVSLYLSDLDTIEDFTSQKQHIQLLRHPWLGMILVINGEIQHIENYQSLYHEMLVHLPTAYIPTLKSALIIGGGSLFAAHEILKYPTVEKVILCDYDSEVLKLMQRHYPHAREVMEDERFLFLEEDAHSYIGCCQDRFELIVNDCFNLALESENKKTSYYSELTELCTCDGVCVDIIYRHIFDKSTTINTLRYLREEQGIVLSLVTVPEYPGILHIETIWGKAHTLSQNLKHPVNHFQRSISDSRQKSVFNYYSPDYIPAYLYLPPYIRKMFSL